MSQLVQVAADGTVTESRDFSANADTEFLGDVCQFVFALSSEWDVRDLGIVAIPLLAIRTLHSAISVAIGSRICRESSGVGERRNALAHIILAAVKAKLACILVLVALARPLCNVLVTLLVHDNRQLGLLDFVVLTFADHLAGFESGYLDAFAEELVRGLEGVNVFVLGEAELALLVVSVPRSSPATKLAGAP